MFNKSVNQTVQPIREELYYTALNELCRYCDIDEEFYFDFIENYRSIYTNQCKLGRPLNDKELCSLLFDETHAFEICITEAELYDDNETGESVILSRTDTTKYFNQLDDALHALQSSSEKDYFRPINGDESTWEYHYTALRVVRSDTDPEWV